MARLFSSYLLILLVIGCISRKEHSVEKEESQPIRREVFASPGKPSAPITMNYKILSKNLKAGDEIEIEVTFTSTVNSPITSEMTSSGKLDWINSERSWQIPVNLTGPREKLPRVKVVAPKEGLFYIHFVAKIDDGNQKMTKAFSIPIKIGDGPIKLKPPGKVVTDSKGQRIIIQKADSNP